MSTNLTKIQDQGLTEAQHIGQVANVVAARFAFSDYRSRKAENTKRRQDNDLALFARYLTEVGAAPPGELQECPDAWRVVTWGLVAGFVQWQLKQGYAVSSVNIRLSTIKTYAKLAAAAGTLAGDELAMIRLVSGYSHKESKRIDEAREEADIPTRYIPIEGPALTAKKAQPVSLAAGQVKALKSRPETAQGRRDKLLICLMTDHGLRCGEVARLLVTDFSLIKGEFTFYRPKVDKVQTHRMTPDTLAAAQAYLASDGPAMGPLFITTRKGGKVASDGSQGMSERAITKRVKALGEQMGIEGLSAHDLRHYWATTAAVNGTAIDRLMDAGGWSSPAMPLRYIEAARIANEGVRLEG